MNAVLKAPRGVLAKTDLVSPPAGFEAKCRQSVFILAGVLFAFVSTSVAQIEEEEASTGLPMYLLATIVQQQKTQPTLPPGMASDSNEYQASMQRFRDYYSPLPIALNADPIWYRTLAYPKSAFEETSTSYSTTINIEPGVGYGTALETGETTTVLNATRASFDKPNQGAAFKLDLINGQPDSLQYQVIEGGTHPHALDNGDGTRSLVIPGVDEGKLSLPDGKAIAPLMIWEASQNQWVSSGIITASHGSIKFDYEGDGDEDVMVQNWEGADYGSSPFILRNEQGSFTPVPAQLGEFGQTGTMFVAPFDEGGNSIGLILTDAVGTDTDWGVEAERNALVFYPYDLSSAEPLQVIQLPLPYFERETFEDVELVVPGWEGNVGTSHDIFAEAVDLDGDNDLDIVISSAIWSDRNPYGVLQLLINYNGSFVDETDSRLFNYVMLAGSHQLRFVDINSDGAVDILVSNSGDIGSGLESLGYFDYDEKGIGGSTRVLVNDGTGHFAVIAHHQIHYGVGYTNAHTPSLASNGILRFVRISPEYNNPTTHVRVVSTKYPYSTGPNGRDPADWGVPSFNEFYYLLHNEEARLAVEAGVYETGLAHYIAEGAEAGLKINASAE